MVREKIGKSFFKVILVRSMGGITNTVDVESDYVDNDGVHHLIKIPKEITDKKWRMVASKYFRPSESFWDSPFGAYQIKLENEAYARAEGHLQFIDMDTGEALNLNGLTKQCPQGEPLLLKRALNVKHIESFVKSHAQAIAWAFLLIGIVTGIFIGFPIGQNAEKIGSAISHVKIG